MASYVEVPSAKLFAMLSDAGFTRLPTNAGREVVFERRMDGWGAARGFLAVRVYTSVREGASRARRRGADAIRVVLRWDSGEPMANIVAFADNDRPVTRGLFSERVFRAGTVEGVLERTKQRMREAWKLGCSMKLCRSCKSPEWPDSRRCVAGCDRYAECPEHGIKLDKAGSCWACDNPEWDGEQDPFIAEGRA